MPYQNTPEEMNEIRLWQDVLGDTTRPKSDHDKAKSALERLNNQGPWAELRQLKARVEAIEERLDTLRKPSTTPKRTTQVKLPKKRPVDDIPF
jgi:hypothetical protein